MEIYNSKQEIGCRILLILVCTKKKMQAETISVYDYFSVHIDDIFSELPCLHPSNPNHSSELVVRKLMIREALSFLVSKGLVQIELSEVGICYYADKFSEDISCQKAHCGRYIPHFDFGEKLSPIVPYRHLPQILSGMTADCRSLV